MREARNHPGRRPSRRTLQFRSGIRLSRNAGDALPRQSRHIVDQPRLTEPCRREQTRRSVEVMQRLQILVGEAELLDVLRTHRGRRIRAIGRLHSWSAAPVADEMVPGEERRVTVTCDLRAFRIWDEAGSHWATPSGGTLLVARGLGDIRLEVPRT